MNETRRGLIVVQPQLGDFIHGDGKLGDQPINPSGDWTQWLPPDNIQNRNGFEVDDCVTQSVLGCVEILERQEFGDTTNWSRRFLAAISGTGAKQGNDPQTVCQALKDYGCVQESEYPFSAPDLATFYQPVPENVQTLAKGEFAKYAYGHSWVNANPADMMDALTYSPLSVGGYAWQFDTTTGYAISPQGAVPEHEWIIYGYVPNSHWLAWDSYEQTRKNVAWNFTFTPIKRHTLHRQTVQTAQAQSAWQRFWELIHKITGLWDY